MSEEMKAKLEKYMMETGYYDTAAIRRDEGMDSLDATWFAFFGNDDDDVQETEKSELLQAAEAHNEAWDKEVVAKQEAEKSEVLSADKIDWSRAIKLHMAELVGDVADETSGAYYQLFEEYAARREILRRDIADASA